MIEPFIDILGVEVEVGLEVELGCSKSDCLIPSLNAISSAIAIEFLVVLEGRAAVEMVGLDCRSNKLNWIASLISWASCREISVSYIVIVVVVVVVVVLVVVVVAVVVVYNDQGYLHWI